MKWNRASPENLPGEGKYVLCKHNRRAWYSHTDLNNVSCVVLSLVRGISLEEREKLEDFDPRKNVIRQEDEHGNNSKPYCWKQFGPGSFFGQEIIWWSYIDDVPYEEPRPENVCSYKEYKEILKMTDDKAETIFTDECWLKFYHSKESEELGNPAFTSGKELKLMIKHNREINKKRNEILWGK